VKPTGQGRLWAGLVVVAGLALGAAAFLRAKPAPVAPPPEEHAPTTPVASAAVPVVAAPPRAATSSPPAPHPPGPGQSPPPKNVAPPPAGQETDATLQESVLMARLRSVAGSDYPLAVELARAGNRRFPDSPDAPERTSILIHALAAQGLSRDARGEAEYAVNHYPDSSWVREIEGFTGAHRHRNLILTDGGVIQAR
jgi:type IV secretory pathway VirB10-like protein